jgi:peptide subunit release factor RF-3
MNCFRWKWNSCAMEIELVQGASNEFDLEAFLAGTLTPVFFGSAINNFGVQEIFNSLIDWAPAPAAAMPPCAKSTRAKTEVFRLCV